MGITINKTVARTEAFLKGMMFDCHVCGQCVLDKTKLICPMSCPKGLRNGPCGGTLEGKCEVYPDKDCVWIRIQNKTAKDDEGTPDLIPSPDANLVNTSSWLNRASGADKTSTQVLPYLSLGSNRTQKPLQTASKLEEKLKAGKFVATCEIRAPREPDFTHLRKEADLVRDHFDAVNATAHLNGKPSMPSPLAAKELQTIGFEAICQSTCRDHTKTSFISELIENDINHVHNTLCLTGDSYVGTPKIKQVFDMDSSLMIYEARFMREESQVYFTGQTLKHAPKTFIGAAINPFTSPVEVPIRRLKQKVAAGADFIQSQLVFDVEKFREFMIHYREASLEKELFFLAGIPVVISRPAFKMIPKIPGVYCPEDILARLDNSKDLRKEGINLARELISQVREIEGINGVHLMLFGSDHAVLPEVIEDLK